GCRQMSRGGNRRADARPWLCLGGALDHGSGAALGLSAAQRAGADERLAHGRQAEAVVEGRDRRARRRLQAAFAGDLARLAILGEPRRLRRHDRRTAGLHKTMTTSSPPLAPRSNDSVYKPEEASGCCGRFCKLPIVLAALG